MKPFLQVFGLLIVVSMPVGWVVHLVRCFTEEQWGFLIAGAIFFPVGWVHGLGVALGIW